MVRRLRIALLKSRRLAHALGQAHDGGSVHVVKQLEALCEDGCEVDLFTRSEAETDGVILEVMPGFRVWRVPFTRSRSENLFVRDFEEGRSFVQGVLACPGFSASSFDAVLLHHWTSGVKISDSLPDALPLLFTPHLLASEKAVANRLVLPDPVARVERELLARADCTIAMSRDEEQSCLRLGARRVERVANGVSKAFFDLPLARSPDPTGIVRLGTVGRLCTQKGINILLEAVRQLALTGIDARLDVVGSSYGEDAFEAELKSRLSDPALAGRVRMLGSVAHQELPAILSPWHVYVQPSLYESQGIALLEAMASGRHIVATGVPAVREFLDDESGRLLPVPPSAEAIVREIGQALAGSDWDARVRSARAAARTYRWEDTTRDLLRRVRGAIRASGWQGARENPRLTKAVERQANIVAQGIIRNGSVAGILLLGSGARGSVKPGSDVDLLVVSDDLAEPRQDWTLTRGPPIDVKWEPSSSLHHLRDLADEAFAARIADRPIVDHLVGARPLIPLRPDIAATISLLLQRRLTTSIQALVAAQMLKQAAAAFEDAASFARRAAPADAQLKVNAGAQLLLQAVMVRLGWTLQSAKRRVEAAVPYSRISKEVRRATSFLTTAVGVNGVTCTEAIDIIAARMQLRKGHLLALRALGLSRPNAERTRQHNQSAGDYYSPAIATGYLKGCINHIRSLSGVPLLPSLYAKWFDLDPSTPAQSFVDCDAAPAEIRQLWVKVMDPKDDTVLAQIAAQGSILAAELSTMSLPAHLMAQRKS